MKLDFKVLWVTGLLEKSLKQGSSEDIFKVAHVIAEFECTLELWKP